MLFVAFTFILLLTFTGKKDRAANRYLAMVLVVAVLRVAGLLPFGSRLPIQFSMAFGSLLFLYVRQIIRPEDRFRRKDLLHFSPLLLELGVTLLFAWPLPLLSYLAF